MTAIQFGPWRPDLPALGNPCLVARNVVRGEVSYTAFRSFVNTITALAERIQGAIAVKETAGGANIYVGTASTLQQLAPGDTAFTDRSKSGGYNCAADETWAMMGSSGSVFAANIADPIQAATVGSTSAFADLSANAPKARRLGIWGPHLVAGNVEEGGVRYPNRLHWAGQVNGIGDPTLWPTPGTDAAAQARSDRRDLDGGELMGITQGEFGGRVYMERKIYAASLVESSLIFDIQPIEQNRGTRYPGSIQSSGRLDFFLSDDGFQMFDGVQAIPIGSQKVDRWFLADLDPVMWPRLCSAIDPVNKLYLVGYPGSGHSGGDLNRVAVFNFSPDVMDWSYLDLTGANLEYLFSAMSLGYNLDTLDDLGFNLDTLPFSLDSRVYQGGVPLVAAVDTSHRLGAFSGTAMSARLTTGDRQLTAGRRSTVSAVTPLVEGATTVSVTHLTRSTLAGSALTSWGPFAMNAVGECPGQSDDRYHRFQLDVTGGFSQALGVDPTFTDGGAY